MTKTEANNSNKRTNEQQQQQKYETVRSKWSCVVIDSLTNLFEGIFLLLVCESVFSANFNDWLLSFFTFYFRQHNNVYVANVNKYVRQKINAILYDVIWHLHWKLILMPQYTLMNVPFFLVRFICSSVTAQSIHRSALVLNHISIITKTIIRQIKSIRWTTTTKTHHNT